MKRLPGLLRLIGFLLFGLILYAVEPTKVWNLLKTLKLTWLCIALLGLFPMMLFKAWRWQILLKMQGISFSLPEAFRIYFGTAFLGNVTPGRAGDFLRVFYVADKGGVSLAKGFASVLMDRICDVLVLFLLGFSGYFLYTFSIKTLVPIVVVFLLFVLLMLMLFNQSFSKPLLRWIFKRSFLNLVKDKAEIAFNDFFKGMESFKGMKLCLPFLFSFLSYVFFFQISYFLALALSLNSTLPYLIFCITLVNIVSTLPVTILGFGTREGALLLLFERVGLSSLQAVSYSMLFFVTFMVVGGIWGGWYWWKYPVKIK